MPHAEMGCVRSTRLVLTGRNLCQDGVAVTIDQAPTRRERKKLETRQALEQAALRLFAQQGYEQTTVEDIAEAADVAVRTFFRYFSSKQDVLFGDVVTDRITRLRSDLANRPEDEDPIDSVRAVLDLLDFKGPDEEEAIMARLELMAAQPSLVTRYLEIVDELRSVMVDFVAERTGLDPTKDPYPLMVGAAFTASWDTAVKIWAASRGRRSLTQIREEAFAVLTRGLRRA
jgi:AcrR family transcriptional regulator